jgi:hypothetical protein
VICIGPISGAAHITNCHDSEISLACHQLRIHETTNTKFFVHVGSNPIVENVSAAGFAPYNVEFPGIEQLMTAAGLTSKNLWENVQDFKWHKAERSPNWYVITDEIPRRYFE